MQDLIPAMVLVMMPIIQSGLSREFRAQALQRLEQDAEATLGRPLTSHDRTLLQEEYDRKQAWNWLVGWSNAYSQQCHEDGMLRALVWRK